MLVFYDILFYMNKCGIDGYKQCNVCKKVKLENAFNLKDKKTLRYACRECGCDSLRMWYVKNRKSHSEKSRRWYFENREKYLKAHEKWYNKNRKTVIVKNRKWREGNIERYKKMQMNNNLKKNYNITIETYEEIYRNQNGVCAICEKLNISGKRLAVDHNHSTGKIRGLLCNKCNTGLGNFNDNSEFLFKASEYLKQNLVKSKERICVG